MSDTRISAALTGRRSAGLRLALMAGAAFGALAGAPALAQDGADEAETVTVWGTRVSSSSLYIGEEDIALRQADHLSDLLRIVPGVDIGGTHSVNQRINFRGLDDRDLSVFVDGALQTNYLFHHMGNLLINADILQSADIQLGSNTVTHGGLGGAIRFDTKDAADLLAGSDRPVGGRLMGSYHSNAQWAYSATGYAQIGPMVDVVGYFSSVDRDNFEDGEGVSTVGSDGTTDNFLVKLGVSPVADQRFELSYETIADEGLYTQRPDMGVRTNTAIMAGPLLLPTEYDRETINARYELDKGDAIRLQATYYTNDLTLWRDERGVRGPGGARSINEAASDNHGVNILAVSRAELGAMSHALTYGAEYFAQNVIFHPDLVAGAPPVEQSAESLAFFVEDEITLDGGLILRPGARFNDYRQRYDSTDAEDDWSDVSLAFAAEYPVTESLRLLGSFTEVFKGPELAEAFVGGGTNKIINPDLEPESGENIEAGFRYTQDLGEGVLNLGANVFRLTIDNYIGEVAVPGSASGEVWDVNRGTAKISGFEASAHYGMGGLDLVATYASSDLDDDDLAFNDTAESLREIGDTVGLEATYHFDNPAITVTYTGLFVMEQEVAGGDPKEAYDVHNISARWLEPFGVSGLAVTAGVDNLFDAFYTSHASRTGFSNHPVFGPLELDDVEPGRNFKITLAQSF